MTATFTLLSSDQYARVREEPNADVKLDPQIWFDVGKSWFFFFEVFESFGEALDKVFVGDYLPTGFFGLYGGEAHLGYISPELASAVSYALACAEPEQVFGRAAEQGRSLTPEEVSFYRDYYFEMRIGFRVATRCGGGLSVCIG